MSENKMVYTNGVGHPIAKDLVFVNKKIIPSEQAGISAADEGLLFGWGLFETLRIYNGIPSMLNEHIVRMVSSARTFNIQMPMNKNEIAEQVGQFIKSAGINDRVLRITLTKGNHHISNMIFTHRPVLYTAEDYRRGFTSKISSIRRNPTSPLVFIKTLNYMDNILAKEEANLSGFDEALMLNTEGKVCEGSMSNIFFIKNGRLHTPAVQCGLLSGITRQLVIEKIAPLVQMEVLQDEYHPMHLIEADEAFLTNSVMQIMPLVTVDGKNIGNGIPGPVTVSMMGLYDHNNYYNNLYIFN